MSWCELGWRYGGGDGGELGGDGCEAATYNPARLSRGDEAACATGY